MNAWIATVLTLCLCATAALAKPPVSTRTGAPCLHPPFVYGNRPGTELVFTVAATGERPMTFEAEGLPAGLALDGAEGVVRGRVDKAGSYAVEITVRNRLGSDEKTVTFEIGDTLALTPPMGWMSWNKFGPNISEELVKETADALVASGLRDVGYCYLVIDDHWHGERDDKGYIHPDPEKFPHGMKALADYVHARGLKLGIYSDAGTRTCGGEPGGYGYEEKDAETYAEWGVDYLKYDYCNAPKGRAEAEKRYKAMARALRAVDRSIVFAVCEWGGREPWKWARDAGGNLWRTTWDIRDTWHHGRYDSGHAGILQVIDRQAPITGYAGPGGWNDPDMLVVGLHGKGLSSSHDGARGCTAAEYETQMALWCMLSAPLLVSCDVRHMDEETRRILLNPEVIALDQDTLGKSAERKVHGERFDIWVKPLYDGGTAIALLNRSDDFVHDPSPLVLRAAESQEQWRFTFLHTGPTDVLVKF